MEKPETDEESPVDAARDKLKEYKAFVIFVLISAAVTLLEPILVETWVSIHTQIILLAMSTVLYIAMLAPLHLY